MGLFKRKPNPERELAAALAERGVDGRATIVSMQETGARRDGVAKELELTLALELPGSEPLQVVHRQFMNRYTAHGLAPGEPVRVMYDREHPQTLMVRGHVRFRTDVKDGEIVVVEVEDLG